MAEPVQQAQTRATLQGYYDEYNRIQKDKVDINELAQYSLVKKLLDSKGKDLNAFISPAFKDFALEGEEYDFAPPVFYTDSSEEDTPETSNELMNYLISRKYSENLLKINNKDISSLISHIKFLRVPKEKNKPLFDKAVEIDFSTHYTKNALESILQDRSACGITSLKVDVISNTGAYYAYQITMNLRFANASILVNNDKYNLLLTTPTLDEQKKPVVYCLIFGWANPTIKISEEEKLKDLYEEQICLLLNIKNYELSFEADGSVNLAVHFIGGAETEAQSLVADVLINKFVLQQKTQSISDEVKQSEEAIKKEEEGFLRVQESYLKTIGDLENQLKNTPPEAADDKKKYEEKIKTYREYIEGDKKDLQTKQEQSQKLQDDKRAQIANIKYTYFLTRMFESRIVFEGKANLSANSSGSYVDFVPINAAYYNPSKEKGDNVYLGYGGNVGDISKFVSRVQKINEAEDESLERQQLRLDMIDFFTKTNGGGEVGSSFVEKVQQGQTADYGEVHFAYMFVGDIISSAAGTAFSNLGEDEKDTSPSENLKFVLGTLDLEQTKVSLAIPQAGVFLESPEVGFPEKTKITLDIATIPIAYNVFAAWFLKNVVEQSRDTYPFNDFVKDFLNDCVLSTLQQYATWETKFISNVNKNSTSTLTSTTVLKTFQDEAIEIYYTDFPYNISEVFDTRKIVPSKIRNIFKDEKQRKKISPFVSSDNFKKKIYKYGFIYGKFGSLNRTGNYKDNLANGIFHFYVGSTTGILKDIKFVPMTGPGRKEAQILNASDTSGKPLNTSFNVIQRYDVNISCFGFQYFKPGQIIFVDTSLIGFGKPSDLKSVASRFTLGGYYLVTNVSHNIEGNDFSTSIVAKFIGRGRTK